MKETGSIDTIIKENCDCRCHDFCESKSDGTLSPSDCHKPCECKCECECDCKCKCFINNEDIVRNALELDNLNENISEKNNEDDENISEENNEDDETDIEETNEDAETDIDSCKYNCFKVACENGHLEIVKLLYSKYKDVIDINSDFSSALSFACENGHFEIVKYLCENGADDSVSEYYGFKICCEKGWLKIVKYFVEKGHNIRMSNDAGFINACINNNIDIVKYFLTKCVYYKAVIVNNKVKNWKIDNIFEKFACSKSYDDIIKKLKLIKIYNKECKTECGICMDVICKKKIITKCNHCFCADQLFTWSTFATNNQYTCPICRHDLDLKQCIVYMN